MSQKRPATKTGRKRHGAELEPQALLRTVKDGMPMAMQDLGLKASQLHAWQSKAGQQGQDAERQ